VKINPSQMRRGKGGLLVTLSGWIEKAALKSQCFKSTWDVAEKLPPNIPLTCSRIKSSLLGYLRNPEGYYSCLSKNSQIYGFDFGH
jgi:hypothetical protein